MATQRRCRWACHTALHPLARPTRPHLDQCICQVCMRHTCLRTQLLQHLQHLNPLSRGAAGHSACVQQAVLAGVRWGAVQSFCICL
eukprot:366563-Chlamydomonas_euryale.AAC.12